MRVLIMGGTRFSGRFFTERCIEKGWSVTLFNRGESNPELFGERVERLVGDRNSDAIEQLRDKTFDAVVDMCGQLPSHVERLARLLEPRVHRYLYISSISAYADGDPDNGETPIAHRQTEDAPLTPFDGLGEEDEDDPMMHYAAFKAECERRILDVFGEGERVTILRPGLIVGPHDPTERLTWWIRRAMRGGQIVAPSAPDQPVQCVDARAMADWMIAALEQNHSGTYHAVSPKEALTFDALIETICDLRSRRRFADPCPWRSTPRARARPMGAGAALVGRGACWVIEPRSCEDLRRRVRSPSHRRDDPGDHAMGERDASARGLQDRYPRSDRGEAACEHHEVIVRMQLRAAPRP